MILAYCRFGDSDIYLYESCSGNIVCCGCSLNGGIMSGEDPAYVARSEAIKHVEEHLKKGDYVPPHVIEDLTEEIVVLGDFVYEENPPMRGELCILEKRLIKGDSINEE